MGNQEKSRRRKKTATVRIKWYTARTDTEGRMYAVLRWVDPTTGARETKTLGHVTAEEAADAAEDKAAMLRLGLDAETSSAETPSLTVRALLRRHIADVQGRIKTGRYPEHEENRTIWLEIHLGDLRCEQLSLARLRRYAGARQQDRGLKTGRPPKRKTVKEEIDTLRRAWSYGQDTGLVPTTLRFPSGDPLKALPEDARPPRELTEGEVQAIINTAATWEKRYRAVDAIFPIRATLARLLQALAWIPARPSEILDLDRQDAERLVAYQQKTLPREAALLRFKKTKGGIGRGWRPVSTPGLEAILAQLDATEGEGDDPLWRDWIGERLNLTQVEKYLRDDIAPKAKVADVTPYDLRKFGVLMIHRQVPNLAAVIKYTGHKSVQTLIKHYLQSSKGEAEGAAARIGWTPAKLRVVTEGEDG